jgi:hypothetical protein
VAAACQKNLSFFIYTSNRRAIEFLPTTASYLVSAVKIVGFNALRNSFPKSVTLRAPQRENSYL